MLLFAAIAGPVLVAGAFVRRPDTQPQSRFARFHYTQALGLAVVVAAIAATVVVGRSGMTSFAHQQLTGFRHGWNGTKTPAGPVTTTPPRTRPTGTKK